MNCSLTIAVDIDDTLTVPSAKRLSEDYGEYYARLAPSLIVIEKLRELKKQGHYICIWSSRYLVDYEITVKWLKKHQVPFDQILLEKPRFDIYLDRNAVNPATGCILESVKGIQDSICKIHKISAW